MMKRGLAGFEFDMDDLTLIDLYGSLLAAGEEVRLCERVVVIDKPVFM